MAAIKKRGTCPYCSSHILEKEDLKVCPGCNVPHHESCWHYNGGCTTFACQGKPVEKGLGNFEDYSFEDLSISYPKDKLVINDEDLEDDESGYPSAELRSEAGCQVTRSDNYSISAIMPLLKAGLLGGFITWLLAAILFNYEYYASYERFNMVLIEIMAFSALMGGVIGSCLGSVEGITSKVSSKINQGIFVGLTLGVLGAALGALLGQSIYDIYEVESLENGISILFFRSIFWGLVGLFIGLGQGISSRGSETTKNGLLGGFIGGFIGGAMFELSFIFIGSASMSALIAITIFGGCIGVSIGIVQEYRKEAWFKVIHGETEGKEYIIQNIRTSLGSNPKCDITLIGDPSIGSQHAEVVLENNLHRMYSKSTVTKLFINDKEVRHHILKSGDIVKIGSFVMVFYEKNV